MKKKIRVWLLWYVIAFVLALFVILFVGTKVTPGTGETSIILTPKGITHFKKWLDLAGWVRLTYKIDFSKYEELYKNDQSQLMQVQKTAQDIILQNIDKRISTLGVSDYNAYVQKLTDGEYLVVEIGGIQDLAAAKNLIGKTVELEFKVPNETNTKDPAVVAERQKLAEDIFGSVTKDPSTMKDIGASKGSQDVYYNNFTDVSLAELPIIYAKNIAALTKIQTGTVYPQLLSGIYHIMNSETDATAKTDTAAKALEGFTMIRYIGKNEVILDQVALGDVVKYTDAKGLSTERTVDHAKHDKTQILTYDKAKKVVLYVGEQDLPGTAWYNITIYQVASGADATQVQAGLEKWSNTDAATVVAQGWKTEDEVKAIVPSFTYDANKKVASFKELDASYITIVTDAKQNGDTIYPTVAIKVSSDEQANSIIKDLTHKTTYSFEDIYVSDSLNWLTAKDPKSDDVLNGAYFKYANVGQSQTGLPVVSIQFDDKGKDIFCNLTEQHIGKQMAIFVGGKLMTAPVIRDKICGGTAQIDGSFDIKGARQLADDLNSGALPAPLLLSHEETIAPSLGQNALNGALIAGICGIAMVYFVMILLYGRKKANIALIGLIGFLVYLLGIIKGLGIVSSLSGIAAIILSLGMAVDANVLMYERIREELASGKSMEWAIEDGYERSWAPIRDGNITTGIIGLLLFLVGVNVFKGFGTMMLINMILILFVVTPLTKKLLRLFYLKK